MKRILLAAVTAAAMFGSAAPPAMACEPDPTCTVNDPAEVVVETVVHFLWPTLRHVGPLIEQIKP